MIVIPFVSVVVDDDDVFPFLFFFSPSLCWELNQEPRHVKQQVHQELQLQPLLMLYSISFPNTSQWLSN